MTNLER